MLKYSNNIKKYKTSFKFLETLGDKISIEVTFLIFFLNFGNKIYVMLCLFRWKTFYKDSFPHFSVFGNITKIGR